MDRCKRCTYVAMLERALVEHGLVKEKNLKTHERHRPRSALTMCAVPCSVMLCCAQGLSGHLVEVIALLLLPVAIAMCGYAIFIFVWRSQMIAKKRVSVEWTSTGIQLYFSRLSMQNKWCMQCIGLAAVAALHLLSVCGPVTDTAPAHLPPCRHSPPLCLPPPPLPSAALTL
jgi:hypothetical protein